ncbi:PfkB family carbohydrate kinase [Photobacterium sp. DNB23_23_1]
MFSELRQKEIYKIIREAKKVKVSELSKSFDVSSETIRNDLKHLESQGFIERCHGGALLGKQEIKKVCQFTDDCSVSSLLKTLLINNRNSLQEYRWKGESKLCVLGSFLIDIIADVEHFPVVGELVTSNNHFLSPGGKGNNQAIAASHAQSKVHFITKIGNDHFNQFAYNNIKESGIESFTIFHSDSEPTGSSIIYLSDEEKSNLTAIYPGANHTLLNKEIDTILPFLSDSDVLLLQGEINYSANLYIAEIAKKLNKKVILNVSPYSDEIKGLYDYVDYIILNSYQSSQWAKIEVDSIEKAKAATRVISGLKCKPIIIILNNLSVVYFDGKNEHYVQAFPSLIEDTMGAFDAFCGAFSAAVTKGKSIHQSVLFGAAFVAGFVEHKGVTVMPTMTNVISRMNKQSKISGKSICSETRF